MYNIIDRHTGEIVATRKTLKSASQKVDKLDLNYGACRYFHKYVPIN